MFSISLIPFNSSSFSNNLYFSIHFILAIVTALLIKTVSIITAICSLVAYVSGILRGARFANCPMPLTATMCLSLLFFYSLAILLQFRII